jgi:hypothetical protein
MINAGYMPLAIYVYFKYSRPDRPGAASAIRHQKLEGQDMSSGHIMHEHSTGETDAGMDHAHHQALHSMNHHTDAEVQMDNDLHGQMHHGEKMSSMQGAHMMHAPKPGQPMWATVAMGVAHCGGGCVLGDLVGEWIIWGTGATIRNRDLWPCLLVDFGFALLFGIAFQYFSIAPMTGEWGPKTMWRAAKADFLSLVFFEVGLFGWMIIFEVAIWNYMLEMNTWTYWWMMQVSAAWPQDVDGAVAHHSGASGRHGVWFRHSHAHQLVAAREGDQSRHTLILVQACLAPFMCKQERKRWHLSFVQL